MPCAIAFALTCFSGEVRVVDRQQIADVIAGRQPGEVGFSRLSDGIL